MFIWEMDCKSGSSDNVFLRVGSSGVRRAALAGDLQRPASEAASGGARAGGAARPGGPSVFAPAPDGPQIHQQGAFQQQLLPQLLLRDAQRQHVPRHARDGPALAPTGNYSELQLDL